MTRITVTISHSEGPTGLWIALTAPAVKLSKYPFRRRNHKCQGPPQARLVYIHLHGLPSIRQEVQSAMLVLLQELFLPAFEGSYDTSFSNSRAPRGRDAQA